jgi:hypothetical protein
MTKPRGSDRATALTAVPIATVGEAAAQPEGRMAAAEALRLLARSPAAGCGGVQPVPAAGMQAPRALFRAEVLGPAVGCHI